MSAEEFTATEATQAVGFSGFTESSQTDSKSTVNALDAMLAWAADSAPTAPKLLALLGDYGTGKTSHALQFSRVLNGGVTHPNRPDATLSALHIDLAYLRGVPGLSHLNVTQIVSIVIESRGLNSVLSAEVVVREVREGRRILVYDGLDELMQSDHAQLHSVFRQLLQVLEPDPVTRELSRARLIVSCRTHYFCDLTAQHEFFNTRLRHSVTRKDYLCLYLLPWKPATVRDYLNRRLTPTEASALSETITTTYNLKDLASRPVLLAMMCEQVGEVLRLREAGGGDVTASTLYAQTVAMWVRRDDEKHVLQATHKPVLMGALACAMWNDGQEFWGVDRLDRWLRKTVDALFPGHYSPEQTQAIQDDLRTATFIVRPGQQGFTFAHRSFTEFFLARHLITLLDWEDLSEITLRSEKLLPERDLSRKSLDFLGELLSLRGDLRGRRGQRMWTWLSYEAADESAGDSAEKLVSAPKSHRVLFKVACDVKLDATSSAIHANLRFADLADLHISDVRMPSLDFRWTNLRLTRFVNCEVEAIRASNANLDSTSFFDCRIADFERKSATVRGLILRCRAPRVPRQPMVGPWTKPLPNAHATIDSHQFRAVQMLHADDEIVFTVINDELLCCWKTTTGKLLWESYSQVRSPSLGKWWFDQRRGYVCRLVHPSGPIEEFRLDGKRSIQLHVGNSKSRAKSSRMLDYRDGTDQAGAGPTAIQSYQIQSGRLAGCIRYFVYGTLPSTACFDSEGRLVDYDEEAANTWLRYLGNGYPQPVEAAWLELDEMGRSLGPKKMRD